MNWIKAFFDVVFDVCRRLWRTDKPRVVKVIQLDDIKDGKTEEEILKECGINEKKNS